MTYAKLQARDLAACVALALELWPDGEAKELRDILRAAIRSRKAIVYVCKDGNGNLIGFAELSIRRDYVEGSETSPVGYIEGLYVKPAYRKKGVARTFVQLAEQWARQQGCKELGSDTERHNKMSQAFHQKVGFTVAEHIVHFIKKID